MWGTNAGIGTREVSPGRHVKGAAADTISRTSLAKQAGMSLRQRHTALRVSNIPSDDFDAAVESDNPPTVSALAGMGKKPAPLFDLRGRAPEDFKVATRAGGDLRRFADLCRLTEVASVVRGSFPEDAERIIKNCALLLPG